MNKLILTTSLMLGMALFACSGNSQSKPDMVEKTDNNIKMEGLDSATFGAGCFWCVEAVFKMLQGVEKVEVGYTGGRISNPTYKEVCSGLTGHVEVARIYFDPSKITYEELLDVFWHSHDPTTLNRQGADEGTQYRSVVFYHNDQQKSAAEKVMKETEISGLWSDPIVTAIEPAQPFFVAEIYHQDYYENNKNQPYCSLVIGPKVEKIKKKYKDKLKEEYR